jgi:hypothetical protein
MLIVESGEQTRKLLQGGLHTALCWFSTRVHENSFEVQASKRAIYNSLHTRNGA